MQIGAWQLSAAAARGVGTDERKAGESSRTAPEPGEAHACTGFITTIHLIAVSAASGQGPWFPGTATLSLELGLRM